MEYRFLAGDIEDLSELRNRYADLMSDLQTRSSFALMDQAEAEYRTRFEELKERDTNPQTENPERILDYDIQTDRRIIEKIEEVTELKGVRIEVVGSWIWITEAVAEPHKAEIEDLGFKFSKRRKRWYWAAKPKTERRYRGKKNFEEIKAAY